MIARQFGNDIFAYAIAQMSLCWLVALIFKRQDGDGGALYARRAPATGRADGARSRPGDERVPEGTRRMADHRPPCRFDSLLGEHIGDVVPR